MERKAHIRKYIQRSKISQINIQTVQYVFRQFQIRDYEGMATNYLLHINVIIKIIIMILIGLLFLVCIKPQLMMLLCSRQQLLCGHIVYLSIFVNINIQDIPKKITSWV